MNVSANAVEQCRRLAEASYYLLVAALVSGLAVAVAVVFGRALVHVLRIKITSEAPK